MKKPDLYITALLIAAIFIIITAAIPVQRSFSGAWRTVNDKAEYSLIAADGYCMITHFDKTNKQFLGTFGGKARQMGKKLFIAIEFNTTDKKKVGTTIEYTWDAKTTTVTSNINGSNTNWRIVDQGSSNLTGNWRFLQRMENGKMTDPVPLQARRTYKLLTASRFQWAAINVETGEFFGTGGGSYTLGNGKYTEHIEFFSRDNSRVGASLSFDAVLKDGNWHHSGLNSKGEPMYEVWGKVK